MPDHLPTPSRGLAQDAHAAIGDAGDDALLSQIAIASGKISRSDGEMGVVEQSFRGTLCTGTATRGGDAVRPVNFQFNVNKP
jgi:hypothetical protein